MDRLTSSDGIDVALHDLGGDGPPAILCHATGFCGEVFRPLADQLRGVHAWAPDLRGHGRSAIPPGYDLSWPAGADDILACVDRLTGRSGSERPVGVGHSGGAAVLALAEQRRPGTFRALYLYEPVVFPPEAVGSPADTTESPLATGARLRRALFPSREAARANFTSKPPMDRFDPAALDAYLHGGFEPRDDGSVVLRCRPDDEARMYQMAGSSGAFEALATIGCPAVVARGRLGPEGGVAVFADRAAHELPHGRLETFDDLGHFGPLENPGEVAASVQRLLDGE